MQTDDALFGANEAFSTKEQTELTKANLITGEREIPTMLTSLKFNGGKIHLEKRQFY